MRRIRGFPTEKRKAAVNGTDFSDIFFERPRSTPPAGDGTFDRIADDIRAAISKRKVQTIQTGRRLAKNRRHDIARPLQTR
jgi:hypothetical protein